MPASVPAPPSSSGSHETLASIRVASGDLVVFELVDDRITVSQGLDHAALETGYTLALPGPTRPPAPVRDPRP